MDINFLRSLVTVAGFIGFVGILVWAYLPARKAQFDEAARLPFLADPERPNE
jgi:cytochrome c oxidase cbb3-type subunit IV